MKKLIVPRVHSNGTGRSDLLAGIHSAAIAVATASKALGETCPHGRDYYVTSPDAYSRARLEYISRAERLDSVYNELLALYRAIESNTVETEVYQRWTVGR